MAELTKTEETFTVVSFLVSADAWQQSKEISGKEAAEKYARKEARRYNVYKVKMYNSAGAVVLELL